jgi:hypothetical protein
MHALALAMALALDPAVTDAMAVCTDGRGHYVAIAAHGVDGSPLFYGDGKTMYHLREQGRMVSPEWFFEPRFFNKNSNENFRGVDWRVYSRVDYSTDKKTCSVTCGERTTALSMVDADTAQGLMRKATFAPSPWTHLPYALARDDRAHYYYVDRGATPATEKNFRLFRGPKGGMKLQKMTDVASDSEGQIFATKTGSLRLILDKKQSTWVENGKSVTLTLVPVEQNYALIFNDLGMYSGLRLGTPCDDL